MSDKPLWNHQREVIDRAKNLKQFALFHSVGTGKTRSMLEILRNIYNTHKRVLRTLIISPLIVTRNWENEIALYTKIPKEKYIRLSGPVKDRAETLLTHNGIAITNYDVFNNEIFLKAALQWSPEVLILDEAHYCKEQSTKRTKAVHKIAESMGDDGYRYLMTGTPIANSQMDVWSLFYILDLGRTFGKSFYGFRNTYFRNINSNKSYLNFPSWVPRPGCDEVIKEHIKPLSSVVEKEQCLDLPPLIRQKIYVDLTIEQARLYKQMKKDMLVFISETAASASIALVKALRLQQIVSGFLTMEDGSVKKIESNRHKALLELIGTIPADQKIIVWSTFHYDYKVIAETLHKAGILFTEAHGLIPEKKKIENLEMFRNSQSVRILIGSPASIGIGINLVEAAYSIWYSRNFSMIQDSQAEARNYRGGSERHRTITRYDLVSPDTVDELALQAVEEKFDLAARILSLARSNI